ncbi:hypothetical protein Ancab_021451 [Ancistrocladus abbreviatus]
MEDKLMAYLYPSLFVLCFYLLFKSFLGRRPSTRNPQHPPGPSPLPIIGHLHLLKHPIHQTLHTLSLKHGPIFSLRFGSRPVVVIESSLLVDECLSKNDITFANRPFLIFGKHFAYNYNTLISAPYGEYFRRLRRIASTEIFSSSRLNIYLESRREEVKEMVIKLYQKSEGCGYVKVDMRSLFGELMFNVLARMVGGKRCCDFERGKEFREILHEVFEFAGEWYPGDFLPILRVIDYQGYEKKSKKLAKKVDAFFQGLIEERKKDKGNDSMIDHLLSLQEEEPQFYTDQTIKGLILTVLIAGVDTTAVTMEWAMSLLLNHPKELSNARKEIDTHIGEERLVDELDLPNLPYLRNIISETLRLYPAVPLLLPHTASQDCIVGGYRVPRDTILLVNVWAIQRDPSLWEDATGFKPERFAREDVDACCKYKYLPFGRGRRACPGMGLGHRVAGLALASLIQCFEWERIGKEQVDMSPGRGLNMPKAEPLEAMCKSRPVTCSLIA